jgi:hypothetical protein
MWAPTAMCPHTPIYMGSYACVCVRIRVCRLPHPRSYRYMYMSSYCHMCVLIPLYIYMLILVHTQTTWLNPYIYELIRLRMCAHTCLQTTWLNYTASAPCQPRSSRRYVSIRRQHTSAYVSSIPQHTSAAYVASASCRLCRSSGAAAAVLTYADVC